MLSTPFDPEHAASEHIRRHGDGVRDIALLVEDADFVYHEAVRRGAIGVTEPRDLSDERGTVRWASHTGTTRTCRPASARSNEPMAEMQKLGILLDREE